MCKAEIQNKREVEGERGRARAGSFAARPCRLWKGLYSQRERERERCTGSVLAHTEYPASNLLHCTVHSPRLLNSTHFSLFAPSHTHIYTDTHRAHTRADTNPPVPCRASARGGHQPAQDHEPGTLPSFIQFVSAQTATLCTS